MYSHTGDYSAPTLVRRPTKKTFRAVFERVDPADLDCRLGAYFTALATSEAAVEGRLLAVAPDGKTLRTARRVGPAGAHLVAVFAHRARLVLVAAPAVTVPFAPGRRCCGTWR
jgi:hypothetical protein